MDKREVSSLSSCNYSDTQQVILSWHITNSVTGMCRLALGELLNQNRKPGLLQQFWFLW